MYLEKRKSATCQLTTEEILNDYYFAFLSRR